MCDFLVGDYSFYELETNAVLPFHVRTPDTGWFILALGDNPRDRPLLHGILTRSVQSAPEARREIGRAHSWVYWNPSQAAGLPYDLGIHLS